ncbi:hypothetical protein OOU_Y34scaffold01191g4, partial [Pyricularia oryzae Y34]
LTKVFDAIDNLNSPRTRPATKLGMQGPFVLDILNIAPIGYLIRNLSRRMVENKGLLIGQLSQNDFDEVVDLILPKVSSGFLDKAMEQRLTSMGDTDLRNALGKADISIICQRCQEPTDSSRRTEERGDCHRMRSHGTSREALAASHGNTTRFNPLLQTARNQSALAMRVRSTTGKKSKLATKGYRRLQVAETNYNSLVMWICDSCGFKFAPDELETPVTLRNQSPVPTAPPYTGRDHPLRAICAQPPEKMRLTQLDDINEDLPLAASPLSPVEKIEDLMEPVLPHSYCEQGSGSIPRINRQTLLGVLNGQYNKHFDIKLIIDCRFEYEYHVYRAPVMARYVRAADRMANCEYYPQLDYPEIHILEGGYSIFFKEYRNRCYPQTYVEMSAPEHKLTCERELGRLRQKRKGSKTAVLDIAKYGPLCIPGDSQSPGAGSELERSASANTESLLGSSGCFNTEMLCKMHS